MATRLFFHNAESTVGGTLPSTYQTGTTPTRTGSDAGVARSMDLDTGSSATGSTFSSLNSTASQTAYLGTFVSPPLQGSQTVGGGNMILNTAERQSNTAAVYRVASLNIYVWRPSTGAKVGTIRDATGSSLGGTTSNAANTTQSTHVTGITSSAVSAADGDVVICEVWSQHQQSMGTAYTCGFYYDGSTVTTSENATVNDHAAFIELTENLVFQQPAVDHATSGALVGADSAVTGSAARSRAFASTGVLTGPDSTVSGAATRTAAIVDHATTGALTGPGSSASGSAARFRALATSGALTGQSSAITGSASRSDEPVSATHETTGALLGPGTLITGNSARTRAHGTSGALAGPGVALTGAASSATARPASGALIGPGALLSGSANRSGAVITHGTSGALAGPGAQVIGSASRSGAIITHATSGVLPGQAASLSGNAARTRIHATTGALPGQVAVLGGSAERQRLHGAAGALAGPGAELNGAAEHIRIFAAHDSAGELIGPGATVQGDARPGAYPARLASAPGRTVLASAPSRVTFKKAQS